MSSQFADGYALLIGVNESAVADYALPEVANDIAAMERVLRHADRCAYDPAHIKVIMGTEATRQGILDGLDWLRDEILHDVSGNAAALVYFSGHGWRNESIELPAYYLIPYDMRPGSIPPRALRAEDFAAAVDALESGTVLAILDCCHSGGMGTKHIGPMPGGFASAAAPATLFMPGLMTAVPDGGAKGLKDLPFGAGRAVLSSSKGEQPSFIRKDRAMSIFTYHIIEALTGHGQPAEGATEVLVSDIMGYVSRHVPESARRDWGREQQPDYRVSGNFAVGSLLGGKAASSRGVPPDPLAPLIETAPAAAIDQRGQSFRGTVISQGSNSQVTQHSGRGDQVLGRKFGGNETIVRDIIVGDIVGNRGVAIGASTVTINVSDTPLEDLFRPLVGVLQATPLGKREEAISLADELKAEAAKGRHADDSRMGRLVEGLIGLVPSAVSMLVRMFGEPILAGIAGPVTRSALERMQGG